MSEEHQDEYTVALDVTERRYVKVLAPTPSAAQSKAKLAYKAGEKLPEVDERKLVKLRASNVT